MLKGQSYLAQGRLDEAHQELSSVIQLHPGCARGVGGLLTRTHPIITVHLSSPASYSTLTYTSILGTW